MLRLTTLLFCITLASYSQSQDLEGVNKKDTLINSKIKKKKIDKRDTTVIRKGGRIITKEFYKKRFQPRKAILYSAVLPGMGQVYNKKYWKVPIVYGVFALAYYGINRYHQLYTQYKNILIDKIYKIPNSSTISESELRTLVEKSRRQRDYYLVLGGLWYLIQLVDAHVDAHLKEFDLNPKLKLSLTPYQERNGLVGNLNGVTLCLKF